MTDTTEHRIFCGGSFCFDYRNQNYLAEAAGDYRVELLGSVNALLRPRDGGVPVATNVVYIGPFYFETEDMEADDIVRCEMEMIDRCTDAIFILDDAACPGTITEIIYANSLKRNLHIFYVRYDEDTETESTLHTPCWYPLLFCQMTNDNTHIYPCSSTKEARMAVTAHIRQFAVL